MSIYDIKEILSSKPHNPHYLKRYIWFIEYCQKANKDYIGYTEKHHICPQAKDLFPEYKSLRKHPWNCVVLTPRQHLIAHFILVKIYPDSQSSKFALWKMFQGRKDLRRYTKIYEQAKIHNASLTKERNKRLVEEGKHNLQGDSNPSRRLVKEGKHHWQTKEYSEYKSKHEKEKYENGDHPFFGERNPSRRLVKEGKHPWQGSKHQKEWNDKRVAEGIHNWQGDGTQQKELNEKRIRDGTHNFLGMINCVDPHGNDVMISKEEYKSQQSDNKEDWIYVHRNSKEGHKRKGIEFINYRKKKNDTLTPSIKL
jgi:hypothetical protein